MSCRQYIAVFIAVVATDAASVRADEKLNYNRDVRPILADRCFACHGPDQKERQADLRLDDRAVAVETAKAIVPGKPDESELFKRIMSDDPEQQMPPKEANKPLSAAEKELLRRWIAEGAEYQGHWAYQKPARPEVPAGENAIDHLVQKRLKARNIAPAAEADRRTLARRLYADLIGLPPPPEVVQAFVTDTSPEAYEKLVDSLLASEHFGERMAIGWLDVVRFADTIGYHSDNPRNIWPYRDYVIRAFNANKRFDEFTIEQLAGDLLPNSTTDQKVASAFNRLLLSTEEGGAQAKDYEARMVGDRVRAVGAVWLGQTIGCAQCHDHKFDPITAKDFYALGAFFADIQEPIIGSREPGMLLATDEQTRELAKLSAALKVVQKQVEALAPSEKDKDETFAKAVKQELGELRPRLERAKKAVAAFEGSIPRCLVSTSGPPRTVRILPRGNWQDETGPVVEPALPSYLAGTATGDVKQRLTRLDLAKWLVSPDHPLTSRVFVNRLWKQFFGLALSRFPDDLGAQGEWPSNPELLDWLAVEFRESNWDVKRMVKTIVMSRTYRQSSTAPKDMLARDPENRELARQSRYRLDAELVRDGALAASGLLVSRIGGPSVKPYQPDGYWENLNFPQRTYVPDAGDKQYRRGLYTWWQRSFVHPAMLAFDAPTREECAADRPRSNIPQQALVLLNDPTYVEAARALAAKTIAEGGADTPARVTWLWRRALQRAPREEEAKTIANLVEKHRAEYAKDPAAAEVLLKVGFHPIPEKIDKVELAAWTSAARVVLNLHETITRN